MMDRASIERELLAWMRGRAAASRRRALRAARARALRAPVRATASRTGASAPAAARTPASVGHWREIPPVPTGAFKELPLRSFPRRAPSARVPHQRHERRAARHALPRHARRSTRPRCCRASRRGVFPDLAAGERMPILRARAQPGRGAPTPRSRTCSASCCARRGTRGQRLLRARGGSTWRVARARARGCDRATANRRCCAAPRSRSCTCSRRSSERGRRLALPAGARVMETGGFKGRARELPRDELYARLHERLGVPPERIVNQYGMTELGSQFYDSRAARAARAAPQARAAVDARADRRPRDAARTVPRGEVGAIQIVDLANTGSVLAIADRRPRPQRSATASRCSGATPGAEARGCSIAADEMLGARAELPARRSCAPRSRALREAGAALRRRPRRSA